MMCGPVYGIMKFDIKAGERLIGAARASGPHSLDHVLDSGEIFLGRRPARAGYRKFFEGSTQRREFDHVHLGQVRDGGPPVPLARDQPLLL